MLVLSIGCRYRPSVLSGKGALWTDYCCMLSVGTGEKTHTLCVAYLTEQMGFFLYAGRILTEASIGPTLSLDTRGRAFNEGRAHLFSLSHIKQQVMSIGTRGRNLTS